MDGPDDDPERNYPSRRTPNMDVRRDDRGYVRCGGTGVARLVRTRPAADRRPGSSSK